MKKLCGLCSAVVICIGMLFIGVTSSIKAYAKETSGGEL